MVQQISEMRRIDFQKDLKDLYAANFKGIRQVEVQGGQFLKYRATGSPGGPEFTEGIAQLYTAAYILKFMLKEEGIDYKVSKLECVYEIADPATLKMEEWTWDLLIRIPDRVDEERLAQAIKAAEARGKSADKISLAEVSEGTCIQKIHLGPYDTIGGSYGELDGYMADNELMASGPAHEIYISDPGRTAPERLKTLARMPVSKH